MSRFLRLWFLVLLSYVTIKFVFNLVVMGWIDLRWTTLLEIVCLPLGQTVVFWFVTRRVRRAQRGAEPKGDVAPTG
ncbi:MAG: hypothetical protein ABSA52_12090 [Candidatus Binatia bacterium]|jgi:hypothetical protein